MDPSGRRAGGAGLPRTRSEVYAIVADNNFIRRWLRATTIRGVAALTRSAPLTRCPPRSLGCAAPTPGSVTAARSGSFAVWAPPSGGGLGPMATGPGDRQHALRVVAHLHDPYQLRLPWGHPLETGADPRLVPRL